MPPITVTIRPDGIIDGGGLGLGGFSGLEWADDSDVTGYYFLTSSSVADGPPDARLSFVNPSIPGNAVIVSVTPRIRLRATGTGTWKARLGIGASVEGSYNLFSGYSTLTTVTAPTRTTRPDGSPWTTSDLNSIEYRTEWYSGSGTSILEWTETYLDIVYSTIPQTPSPPEVLSPVTNPTPQFRSIVTDLDYDTIKGRFEIYQNDGVTLVGSVDGPYYSGGVSQTVYATYSSALPVGQYKARTKVIDDGGRESGWSSLTSFQINTAVNKDYGTLWNVADPTTPVFKSETLLWNVDEEKAKQIGLLWNVYENVLKDLTLKWNVGTAWVDVPEAATTWTEVTE